MWIGNPGGSWTKIVLRGDLRGDSRVFSGVQGGFRDSGGGWICLSVTGVCHTPSVTSNSGNTSKTKETGQKRNRYCFSVVQTTFLETQLKDNKLDTLETTQKVAAVFTKETKETFDLERIQTWFRTNKKKNKGGGEEGACGSSSKT